MGEQTKSVEDIRQEKKQQIEQINNRLEKQDSTARLLTEDDILDLVKDNKMEAVDYEQMDVMQIKDETERPKTPAEPIEKIVS